MPKQAMLYEYQSNEGWELRQVGNPNAYAEDGALFVPKEDFDALLEEYLALQMSQMVGRHTRG